MWNVVGFKPVFDCGTWGFGCFTVIDDLGPGSKLLSVICWISVIHEYLSNNEETWDDRDEFPNSWVSEIISWYNGGIQVLMVKCLQKNHGLV